MAKGIEFYREYAKVDCLKNSYETQLFTERFNSLFDILNRKYPAEGIKKNSKDFEVPKYFFIIINLKNVQIYIIYLLIRF